MPKKLTKDQKYNRKLRKEGQKDYKRVPREGKTASTRVTRRSLCVRVSTEAAERIKTMADDAGLHQWQMATRIIHNGIAGGISARGYASYNHETGKFEWNESCLNPPDAIKYKRVTGDKQLNQRISSTAWNKLACYANELKQSKHVSSKDLFLITDNSYESSVRSKKRHVRNSKSITVNGVKQAPNLNKKLH